MVEYEIDQDNNQINFKMFEYTSVTHLVDKTKELMNDPDLPGNFYMLADLREHQTRFSFSDLKKITAAVQNQVPKIKGEVRIAVCSYSSRVNLAVEIAATLLAILPVAYKMEAFSAMKDAQAWLEQQKKKNGITIPH